MLSPRTLLSGLLLTALLVSPLVRAGDQAKPAAPGGPSAPQAAAGGAAAGPTISQFLKVRVPNSVRLTPDGTLYCRDWPDGVNQLYRRAKGAPLDGALERLTDFKDGLASYSISPDAKHIALAAAPGGNEQTQISLLDPATKAITPALQNPSVVYSLNAWLRDSSGFIYSANDASPRDFHLYRYDLASKLSTKLLGKEGEWRCADVTDDASRLLVGNFKSASDARVFELDAKTGKLTDLSSTPEGQASANSAVGYLPGEKSILIESDFDGGVSRLYVRDLADTSAKPREAVPALHASELDGADTNPERTILATLHNEEGYATARAFRLPTFDPIQMPEMERGVVGAGEMRGNTLIYTMNNARNPGIAYAFDAPAPGAAAKDKPQARTLTARMDKEPIDLAAFRLPELVKYKSFDGTEIPAFLYLPAGAKKGSPIPFVVNFHGGPEGQSRPTFSSTIQYLVSKGYGVMLPNVRGSTGYGRAFQMMDDYKKRWSSVKDGVEGARWLVKEGYARNKKIAAYGGSYGGFMTVAAVIEGADVFGAGVDVVGVVNFRTFLEQTKSYRQKLREAEYGPLTDTEFLESVSPINRIEEIKVPMMIAHGLNDPRVPVGEAMQLAVGLQQRGYDPELLFCPDEGHGFQKLANRILFSERMVKFLDKHIAK